MISGIANDEILKQIDKNEIFKAICKIKNINKDEITTSIIKAIEYSDIEDTKVYIDKSETWDDYAYAIREYDELFINYCDALLLNKEDAIKYLDTTEEELKYFWVELTEEEKEFIKMALECEVTTIKVNYE